MISVILVSPETSGNVGAVARAMANFDFKKLILINPECDHLDEEALKRAKHAKPILKQAKVYKSLKNVKADYLIATSSIKATDYNLPRSYLTPEQLKTKINKKQHFGIVFGRESQGLFNDEIEQCDFSVKINTSKKYSAMNLSHAVTIILYELKKDNQSDFALITKTEKSQLLKIINEAIKRTKFPTVTKQNTQKKLWKNVIGKASLTKRESLAMMGFFRKVNHPKQKR